MGVKLDNRTILIGDVMDKIKEIPKESVDCIISSPPYTGD
jgi:DNA modification methylase